MPRHNYKLVQPRVKALCKAHGVPYVEKTLYEAMRDIVTALKDYGQIWHDAYYHV
jgi:hypothetical protein